jgi:Fe-S oxidoreductase
VSAPLTLEEPGALVAEVAQRSGQNLFACYQCGKCSAGCPFGFSPQRLVRLLQLGQAEAALADETVHNCAGCFTCTADCPKGVDPVRIVRALRSLDGGHQGNRRRSWVFANNHRLARLGSAAVPFSNWFLRLPGSGLAAQQLLGIHRKRSLPPFARPSFPAWFRGHTPAGAGHLGTVLLFHDTFMDYNLPQTGIAATELLEKAGFRVELTDSVCCGRPMISKGFFDEAREHARANVARLYEQVRDGAFIVGCEPSCLLTVRDEYGDLLDDAELERQWRTVASRSLLIDEFLAGLAERGELELRFEQPAERNRPVLFHGHCHQKALADPAKSLALLRLAGYEPELVNTACCGMAGAFGYEKEHYALSRAAGERELFPAVRAHADAQVVVMGISCHQQIEHFTGRPTRHLAQALADAVP